MAAEHEDEEDRENGHRCQEAAKAGREKFANQHLRTDNLILNMVILCGIRLRGEVICLYVDTRSIAKGKVPVSYTHLTLPTIYSV